MNRVSTRLAGGARRYGVAVAFLAAIGCDRGADDGVTAAANHAPVAETASATPSNSSPLPRDALIFDPATVKVGDILGGLRVERVDIDRAVGDMGYVGDVRFDGEVTISGERMNHPDFPEVRAICMRVDSVSVRRLPRFPDDTRRTWLCFENRDEAARRLGEAGTRGPLTVVIDRYQTVRHFSDVYDTAMLVRVVEDRRER
jgi:hypothetical protein